MTGIRGNEGATMTNPNSHTQARPSDVTQIGYSRVSTDDQDLSMQFDALNLAHDLKATQKRSRPHKARLWPWERTTAWRRVIAVMADAGLQCDAIRLDR